MPTGYRRDLRLALDFVRYFLTFVDLLALVGLPLVAAFRRLLLTVRITRRTPLDWRVLNGVRCFTAFDISNLVVRSERRLRGAADAAGRARSSVADSLYNRLQGAVVPAEKDFSNAPD